MRDRLSLSVLEDGSRKAERLKNFLDTSNSTVQKFLYWEFLANILPSSFLLPIPTVTTYRATTGVTGHWLRLLEQLDRHDSGRLRSAAQREACNQGAAGAGRPLSPTISLFRGRSPDVIGSPTQRPRHVPWEAARTCSPVPPIGADCVGTTAAHAAASCATTAPAGG